MPRCVLVCLGPQVLAKAIQLATVSPKDANSVNSCGSAQWMPSNECCIAGLADCISIRQLKMRSPSFAIL